MARNDRHRWWDWRINLDSGESIRSDDKRAPTLDDQRLAGQGWWWTLAWRNMGCQGCLKWIAVDAKIAYNHQTKQVYCPACAEAEGIAEHCELSRRLLRVGT
jgi:hypothetical protein